MAYELNIDWEELDDVFVEEYDCEDTLPDDIDEELREKGFKFDEETGMYTVIPKMLVLF